MKHPGTKITELFEIEYPIIQGGMIWCSGWELASAVSNSGGLGLIGSGSMDPELLRLHIRKTRENTQKPFGVNIPLIYKHAEQIIKVVIEEDIKIVFTSAGNPKTWTGELKDRGCVVAHVVSSTRFAEKSQLAGVDAIVAEGFEAGGHNGVDETTTLSLIPNVRKVVDLPLIAAGGIGSGQGILAALALGADGVQIGSLFASSAESSAHSNFKNHIFKAGEGETRLVLKQLIPVRLLRNPFSEKVQQAEKAGASNEELLELLGTGRARLGMFDGNLEEGELEIGQVSAGINRIRTVAEIMESLVSEYREAFNRISLKSL